MRLDVRGGRPTCSPLIVLLLQVIKPDNDVCLKFTVRGTMIWALGKRAYDFLV